MESAQHDLDVRRAFALVNMRDRLIASGDKPTESVLTARVACDSDVIEGRTLTIDTEAVYRRSRIAVELAHRRAILLENLAGRGER